MHQSEKPQGPVLLSDPVHRLDCSKKTQMIAAVKKGNGVEASSSKKGSYSKKNTVQFPFLPLLICRTKKPTALLE